jgi:hypothetical protein
MPDQLFAVIKHPDGKCGVLQLESAADAQGGKIEFWVQVAEVSQGYAFAQSIVDRMNTAPKPTRARS